MLHLLFFLIILALPQPVSAWFIEDFILPTTVSDQKSPDVVTTIPAISENIVVVDMEANATSNNVAVPAQEATVIETNILSVNEETVVNASASEVIADVVELSDVKSSLNDDEAGGTGALANGFDDGVTEKSENPGVIVSETPVDLAALAVSAPSLDAPAEFEKILVNDDNAVESDRSEQSIVVNSDQAGVDMITGIAFVMNNSATVGNDNAVSSMTLGSQESTTDQLFSETSPNVIGNDIENSVKESAAIDQNAQNVVEVAPLIHDDISTSTGSPATLDLGLSASMAESIVSSSSAKVIDPERDPPSHDALVIENNMQSEEQGVLSFSDTAESTDANDAVPGDLATEHAEAGIDLSQAIDQAVPTALDTHAPLAPLAPLVVSSPETNSINDNNLKPAHQSLTNDTDSQGPDPRASAVCSDCHSENALSDVGSSAVSEEVDASDSATTVISDSDVPPTLAINDVTVGEDDKTAVFTVRLSAATGAAVSFDYATGDISAMAGTDYQATRASVTLAPGETSTTLTVAIADDFYKEGDETFSITLSEVSANVDLAGSDLAGEGTISAAREEFGASDSVYTVISGPPSVREGDLIAYTVALVDASGHAVPVHVDTDVTVAFVGGSTQTQGGGTQVVNVKIPSGQSHVPLKITTVKDVNFTDESLLVAIQDVTDTGEFEALDFSSGASDQGVSMTTVISDGDVPPTLAINDVTVGEDDKTAVFTVRLSAATGAAVSFDYATGDISAMAGTDYQATRASVTLAPGETSTTLTVAIADDFYKEGDETFSITLSEVSANVDLAGSDLRGVGTISDFGSSAASEKIDAADSVYAVIQGPATVAEGELVFYKVRLLDADGHAITVKSDVSISVAFSKSSDYSSNAALQMFKILSGTDSAVLAVLADHDDDFQNEIYSLKITGVEANGEFEAIETSGMATGASSSVTTIITDDDVPPPQASNDMTIVEEASSGSAKGLAPVKITLNESLPSTESLVLTSPVLAGTAPIAAAPASQAKIDTVLSSTRPTASGDAFTDPFTMMAFVFIKGGCFIMGSNGCGMFDECSANEEPSHEVCLDDFWMGKYEVTQAQWQKVMGNSPSRYVGDDLPVEQVSWNDTQNFLRSLNRSSGGKYRLPTEAEWEYAARGGGGNEIWAGTDSRTLLGDYAWYTRNSDGQTHPVGQKQPNALGLHDMTGNVWEWCSDSYDSEYYAQSPKHNPPGPSGNVYRVERGGGWVDTPLAMRSAARKWSNPEYRVSFLGLRLVLPAP